MLSLIPPTDNLYKFLAITGLIIFISGWLYPLTKGYELEIQIATFSADIARAEQDKNKADLIELRKNYELEKIAVNAMRVIMIAGVFSSGLGLFLMYQGFNQWYWRVQKPLDDEFAKKGKEAQGTQ